MYKVNKKILSLVLTIVMLLGTFTTALAADFDITHITDPNKNTDILKYMDDLDIYDEVSLNLGDYEIEYEGEGYLTSEVQAKLDGGAKNLVEAIIQIKDEAGIGEDLKVTSISAINKTTVQVTFDRAVDKAEAASFTIEGGRVISSTLSENKMVATLDVTGLDYDKEYKVVIDNVVVNGKAAPAMSAKFATPDVEDLWDLQVVPARATIVADGRDNTTVAFKLVDNVTGEVDVNANDMVLDLNTTYGSLGQERVTVQKGVAEVVLRSEFNAKGVTAKVDAQIIEASGDYAELIGKVEGSKNIPFTAPGAVDVEARYLTAANTNEADRVTLTFDKEVALSDFIKTDARGNLTGVLRTDNKVKITQEKETTKELKVKGFLAGPTNKTLIAVLGIDRTSEENLKETVLTDNQQVEVAVTLETNGEVTESDQTFNFTDARNPQATSVTVEKLNQLKIKFSEPVAKASFLIDARYGSDKFELTYGKFFFDEKAKEFVDERTLVDLKLGADYDDDGGNNKGYFKGGNHVLQISNIYDFAALTDRNNIGTTQKLNFLIEEDKDLANASVRVDSPHQYRIVFDRDATIEAPLANNVELQVYDTDAKEFVKADVDVNDIKAAPTYQVKRINGDTVIEQYKVEITNSWSGDVYKTETSRNNYYNDRFQLVIKEGKLKTTANGKTNSADVVLPLNFAGSPMNSSDTTSPVIQKMEETLEEGKYLVTMSEPIQKNAGPEVGSVEFEGKDKDGKIRTFVGRDGGVFTNDGLDNKFYVYMDAENQTENYEEITDIVAKGGSEDWKLVIRDVTDDIGNKAATVTDYFKVLVDPEEVKFEVSKVEVKEVGGPIVVTFTEDVAIFGSGDATDYRNYNLNGSVLPVGTEIRLGDTDNVVEITVAENTLLDSNVLDVGKNIESKDGLSLVGKTSWTFKNEATVPPVDKTSIDTAITAANEAKLGVEISVDGNNVAVGTEWVTQDVNDVLYSAIQTATDAKATVTSTQEAEEAAGVLNAAVTAYNNAKADGTLGTP